MPRTRPVFVLALLAVLDGTLVPAAEVELPPADKEPLLRVDAGGPLAFVTALAFSPDGKTLYAGGWDKVIRVWTQNDKGVFQLNSTAYRVPVGPGLNGAINALALSPDGNWLAAAGNGMARQIAGFQQLGFIVPSFGARDAVMLRDVGTIYLFNTRDRSVRMLRGHRGYVTALTFGPQRGKDIPPLLSVAVEEKEGGTIQTQRVARVWNANKGESVAELPGLPSTKQTDWLLPGVSLWQNDDRGGALRAALALYDGKLRLWDPARASVRLQEVNDLRKNLTVAHLGRGRLLTAGHDGKQWRLARWQVPAEGKPKRDGGGVLGNGFPRALGLSSRQADGTADLAAVLALVPGQEDAPHQYRLRLADLNTKNLSVVADLRLWRDSVNRQPPLATSVRGKHLAVANNADHTIRIYAVRDLLGDKEPVPQILRTRAVFFHQASFVRRGKDLGLLLKRDGQGDWLFDAGKRRLTDDLTDWQPARPPAGAWKAMPSRDARTIIVSDREVEKIKITIPEKEIVTSYALLPPGGAVKLPLLAVASHKNGQPQLRIYNAKSGERLREFTGHTERLRSVAFAPDGRLLVSTADDGTVCVWSLTDLDTIVGKHGRLPGVTVGPAEKGAKGVKVLEVKDDSPVRGKLKRGEVVAGLVQSGKLQRIDSPRGFYEALFQLSPGTEINLRRGNPEGNDDIRFRVGQGIDERKPLFSLFVIGGPKAADCEWIGWSPIGPYEASSPRAEKYLGWHFNTGDPKAPTRFADAGQYRKFYYRANLLDQLLQRGALGRIDPPQLPPPVLAMWVTDADRPPAAEQETVIVRRPRIDLTVALFERPLSSLTALTWQLDNRAAVPLDLEQRGEASFQVPLPPLARGEHRFVVTARTRDGFAPPTRKSLILRYQPLPPEVAIKEAGQQRLVRQADFTLEASIKPRVSGENVVVTIRHRHDEGQGESQTQTLAARDVVEGVALPIQHRLKLRPGNNEIELSAVNGAAPAGAREQETAIKKLSVFYYFKAKPPIIAFRRIVPEAANEAVLPVDLSQSMIVHRSIVKIIGQIKAADEPLTSAQWDRGKATPAAPLERFEAGKHKEFTFEQRLRLNPGKQTIRLRAKTKNSDTVEHNLELTFQPPVPVVSRLIAPRDGQILEGSDDERTVRVRGEVRFPPEALPSTAVIRVNDKRAVQPAVLDEKTGTLRGSAVLGPGENRIWVEVSNKWGASSSSEVLLVRYVRPPIITAAPAHKAIPRTSLINLQVPVLSRAPLERDTVRIEVNGQESTPKEVRIEEGKGNRWTVHLSRVPLDAGSREQKIVVFLANTEAACRSAPVTIRSETVLPPPEAEFLEPRQDGQVSTPTTRVRFHIRSEGKLETVRLMRQGRLLQSFDVGSVRPEGNKYELTATINVDLEPGTNQLSLEAVSVSGRLPDSPQRVLNFVPPPLRIDIDKLTEQSADGAPANKRRLREGGDLHFAKVASGQVWLHGRVYWTGMGEARDSVLLQVFVNGFQQRPYEVYREADKSETPFQVPLLLNRPTGNRISLVAYRQYVESPTAVVDCAEPITAQRLHVLALSPYSQPKEVQARLERAFHDLEQQRGGRPPVFTKVEYLTPLTGDRVQPHYLFARIRWFKQKIRQAQLLQSRKDADKAKGAPTNEILLIYYEGREKIDDTGHYFETYSPSGDDAFDMPCAKLASYLETVPGAHVLLLDVDRAARGRPDRARDTIAGWRDKYPEAHSHVVVIRCARRSEAGRRSSVRLIPVLQQQIPQAGRLSDLIALIENFFLKSNDRDLLIFTKYLPPELADLKFGPSLP